MNKKEMSGEFNEIDSLVPHKNLKDNDLSGEQIFIINRILKDAVKLDVFKSEDELNHVFSVLSTLNVDQLNHIFEKEIYKKGSDSLIEYCKSL